jgi:16S rRNA (cytidine1402-2'-O)-methyltransferase
MPGVLYVVGTPIGNLEDITLRALRLLKEVDLIAAEDTRVTRKLLSHYNIHTSLTSFHQHTRGEKAESIVARIVGGDNVALVSDAGMPGISDPGAELIDLAINANIRVLPIPGANAAISALVASGLPTNRFAFEGFPPRTKTDRKEFFNTLREERRTFILYESPGRVVATLKELFSMLGNRKVAICRELTKLFEEVFRGDLAAGIDRFQSHKPRGEFTIVVAPPEGHVHLVDSEGLEAALKREIESGASSRDAVLAVSKSMSLPRRLVYQTLIKMTSG